MKTITETTKLKNATWVKIAVNNVQVAIVWADNIEVQEVRLGKHYVLTDGDRGIIGFAYTPATIGVNDTCEIESPVNQEVKA